VCAFLHTLTVSKAGTFQINIVGFASDGKYETYSVAPAVSVTSGDNYSSGCEEILIDGGNTVTWELSPSGVSGSPVMRYWLTLERMQ
jgi:hypothetical protein